MGQREHRRELIATDAVARAVRATTARRAVTLPYDDASTPAVVELFPGGRGAAGKPAPLTGRARWERSLNEVTTALRTRLRRTLPSLTHEHDDLLHDTLAALTTHAQRAMRDGLAPAMWGEPVTAGPLEGGPRDELLRIAHTILRRRVADLFRARSRAWQAGVLPPAGAPTGNDPGGQGLGVDDAGNTAAEGELRTPEAERRALLVRMLRVCSSVLDEMSDEDRELLESAADERDRERPLTDRERQRLRRARLRLTAAIRDELGDDAASLLRDEG